MKVIDVYSKRDLDIITCLGKPVKEVMDNVFDNFPKSYRKNYDKNLESLEIWHVDEHYDGPVSGEYSDMHNIIVLRNLSSIVHELIHMAARDNVTCRNAFTRVVGQPMFEDALIEGMTEYLEACALEEDPDDYFFETFVASMLSDIPGIFEPYFIPSYDKFIKLFKNKRDIISLMYSLSYYANGSKSLITGNTMIDTDVLESRIENSIKDTIDSLLDIQLSMGMSQIDNKIYAEKFMALISQEDLVSYLGDIYKGYLDYANLEVNKRILRRI